jgi:hypothetical protein
MGWIKLRLPDDYHDRLRDEVDQSDKTTDELASHWMMEYMDITQCGVDDE